MFLAAVPAVAERSLDLTSCELHPRQTTIPSQCGEARHLRSIFVETLAETTAEHDNRRTRSASN
jgi:hypothetical protein